MKKSDRISAFVSALPPSAEPADPAFHPYYLGYFTCFNAGDYYEAHDVLEQLWLACRDSDRDFYQGLIQIAGAFVHLRKQRLRPEHPKDGRRLRPAVRLFHLGLRNLERFGSVHLRLDLESLRTLCTQLASGIQASDYRHNPWTAAAPPHLELLPPL